MSDITYNFVVNCLDSELKGYTELNIDDTISLFSRYDLEWCLQAYLILRKRNVLSVKCSNSLTKNAINIIHSSDLIAIKGGPTFFIVCIQADFPHRGWAHFHIVQNKAQKYRNGSWLPLWLQPGLIKRAPNRRGIKRVAYAGQVYNGNLAGNIEMWLEIFQAHGIEFVTLPSGSCNDLSEVDVLIGIRSFDTNPYFKKPPSKLINAWHSEIPFVGGHDSAFKQIGSPGKDYLIAASLQEVVESVLVLQHDSTLYNSIIRNGLKKADLYTNEAIAKSWEKVLAGPVLNRYHTWKSRVLFERVRFLILFRIGNFKHSIKQLIKKVVKSKAFSKLGGL